MRVAILMTNTDETAFAQRHPKDGEKFTQLMQRVRPDWDYLVYSVKDGIFPSDLAEFDAAIVTGSPASVHDEEPWIGGLEALVRRMAAADKPIFGACFGHQIVATALGGRVEENPDGWVAGAIETEFAGGEKVAAYAAHSEQVVELPRGARTVAVTPGCPLAGYAIGSSILTTQYHPEMTVDFVDALLDEFSDTFGDDVTARAKASLAQPVDIDAWAERIANFFEQAHATNGASDGTA